ncbi:MAG: sn-glycerol-3-phosphate ABC transporter ATP-binding protein UgpC [Tepidibacter sp.]|uniref:ABC transporter ATP-binding protein n=1 Tax=Tepidibacter sp. TaxID=2529387 RepID=UPI0025D2044A|nr:sn-glycerol-3-phosphate ABC transporter ATP-binding protein UgpC [Tepidibacter sp.]MCT4508118.1 sn-glycerol-3-phosphate ABC transporter ATP-binding protein UgpC [Tepidibacter sp.]
MSNVILNNICKEYDNGYKAVKSVNIDINDKEFVVLVGPSGCGKSTTLRMIAGLEDITSGEIKIEDRVVNELSPKDRDIAMVFQNYALYPHMSVYDNMAFALKLRKIPKDQIDEKVKEAAKILGLESVLNRKPKALSGGQRQRVALGRAIVREPKVFLMDEPLSNLDAKLRTQMRTEISKLHKKLGTTFIYVTHDQVEAMTMGDRIVVMKDGIVQQMDTPQELYQNPKNMFVAGFIGAPQMNLIEVSIDEENENIVASFNDVKIRIPMGNGEVLKKKGYIGKNVFLGIRPEDIHMEDTFIEASKETAFNAKVEIQENMGAEIYVYLNVAGESVTARLNTRYKIEDDAEIVLAMDGDKIHLFDIDTEENILLS